MLECLTYEKLSGLTAATGFTAAKIATGGRWAQKALITVETGAIRFTLDGTTPVVTGASEAGHILDVGQSYEIAGYHAINKFRCINEAASNGAEVFCSFFF